MAEAVKCESEAYGFNVWLRDYIEIYAAYRLAEHKCYEHEDKTSCKHSEAFFKEAKTKSEILMDKLLELIKCLEGK